MSEDRRLYRNREDHVIGVVALDHKQEPQGTPLQPGETVWLSEVERRLTANAPAAAEENPFTKGSLEEVSDDERPTTDRPFPTSDTPVEAPLPDGVEQGTLAAPADEGKVIPPEDVEATQAAKAAIEAEEKAAEAARIEAEEQAALEAKPEIEEETGTQVEPEKQGEGEEGQAQEEEEVATPDAALIDRAAAVGLDPADLTRENLEQAVAAAEEAATAPGSTVADLDKERASGKGKW